jgi:hypothetical protein
MVGFALSGLVCVALVAIGVAGLVAPGRASAEYGIVLDDPRALAFIRAMAVRDLAIGGILALMVLAKAREMLAWALLVTMLIAVVDFAVVTLDRRPPARPRIDRAPALHAGGIVGLLVTAAALLAGY